MNEQITIPADGIWILNRLQEHGYVGYAVGGCVRDALLHRTPHDWDFCTSATPEQIQACFSDVPCLTIGSQHGTIGVLRNHTVYEITTFRKETTYHDHRHPDAVQFADSLQIDLQRRDFTINAMAYHPETGIIDPFHGAADLQKRQLRCVGVPTERFTEDALRILRAVRFAAVYGLTIQPETAAAMEQTIPFLKWVSAERILSECDRIVTAPYAAATLAVGSISCDLVSSVSRDTAIAGLSAVSSTACIRCVGTQSAGIVPQRPAGHSALLGSIAA